MLRVEMNRLCIFHPASEAQGCGLLMCKLSEEHPLHSPKYLQILANTWKLNILWTPPPHLKVNCKDDPIGRHGGEEVEGDEQDGDEGHQG